MSRGPVNGRRRPSGRRLPERSPSGRGSTRSALVLGVVAALFAPLACGGSGQAREPAEDPPAEAGASSGDADGGPVGAAMSGSGSAEGPGPSPAALLDTIPGTVWTEADWAILVEKVRWADEHRLDTLPIGDAMAALGRTFVGATYTPGTLEAPGPEHLVVNLRELDCVTFIENVWALTRFHRSLGVDALGEPVAAREAYEGHLRSIRYRDGILAGYPSRLHYFSDWLWNHEDRGDLRLVTADLGGVPDSEPLDFMSTHPDAYRQLADPDVWGAIRAREEHLQARGPRIYLPEGTIAAAEAGIRDGDIIAATSTVAGLDIAHTGIAVWEGDRLHLLHAPLVGRNVEISALPLAERIDEIGGQDGILVARLVEGG